MVKRSEDDKFKGLYYVDEDGNRYERGQIPNGAVIVDGFPENRKPDSNLDFSDLAVSGGSGLLAYSIAKGMMDEDGGEKKKRNAFDRLLSKLIPVGIGGLGAYAGHRLGQSMKTAQANSYGPRAKKYAPKRLWGTFDFPPNGGYSGVAAYPPDKFSTAPYWETWNEVVGANKYKNSPDEMKTWGDAMREAQMRASNKQFLAQLGGWGGLTGGAGLGVWSAKNFLNAKKIESMYGGRQATEAAVNAADRNASAKAIGKAVSDTFERQIDPSWWKFNKETRDSINKSNVEQLRNAAEVAEKMNPPPDPNLVQAGREARGKRYNGKILGWLASLSGLGGLVSLLGLAPRFGENAKNYQIAYDTMTPAGKSSKPKIRDVRGYDSSR